MEIQYQKITAGLDIAIEWSKNYAPKIAGALFTLIIGRRIIKRISKFSNKALSKSKIDITVSKFLSSLISIGLKIVLLISVAGMFGIQTTSFIALIGAAGLAIGMSLQGSLSNFAGGVLILFFKPYKIGDLIEAQNIKGYVTEIGVFTTSVTTFENNVAIIPNGPLVNNNIINYTTNKSRRVDVHVGIAYDTDINTAKTVLLETIKNNQYTLTNPPPGIYITKLGDSSIDIIVRGFARPDEYRDMYCSLTEEVKKALDTAKIEIPFPQRVIHTKI